MRENRIKRALENGEAVFGTMVSDLRSPGVPQMLATAGFEMVVFDSEHSGFSIQTVADQVIAARAADIVSVVRIPNRKYDHLISRPLDVGAQGLLVPNVHTVEEAENAVKNSRYYPDGMRGSALSRIHSDFDPGEAEDFMREANDNILLILQIESKEAVEEIENIVSIPGVDAAFIGPNDLSQSLGIPGQTDHPRMMEAIRRVIAACEKHDVAPGIHVHDVESAESWLEEGMRLLLYLNDIKMIMNSARRAVQEMNGLLRKA